MQLHKFFLSFFLILFTQSLVSQNIEGKITYSAIYNGNIALQNIKKVTDDPFIINVEKDAAANAKDIEITTSFDQTRSYSTGQNIVKDSNNRTLISARPNHEVYTVLESSISFIKNPKYKGIVIERKPFKWEITNEKKQIGSYECLKAYTYFEGENSTGKFKTKVEAWFTPQISASVGPYIFSGLPGAILELTRFRGTLTYHATSIQIGPDVKVNIKEPKGKIISQEEADERIKNNYYSLMNN